MKHLRRITALSMLLTLTACGKKSPLIYPDMLVPAAPSDLSIQQSGKSMKLSFVIPSKDLAGRNIGGVSGVTILKRDEPSGQGPGCPSCTADFALFRKLNLDLLPTDSQRYGSLLIMLDGDVQTGRVYTYRVVAVTKERQEGALSAPLATVMVSAPLPPALQAVSQPTEIQLDFVGVPPVEGVIAGYNIYRAPKGEPFPLLPLNRALLTGNHFVDEGLNRGTTYVYGVRTVVRLPSGAQAESGLSNEAEGRLKDDE